MSNGFVPHPLTTKLLVTHETGKMNAKHCRYNLHFPFVIQLDVVSS